jgi:MFS family permease
VTDAGRTLVIEPSQEEASALASPYLTTTVGIVTLVTLIAFESLAVSTAMPVLAADLDAVRNYGSAFSVFLTTSLLGVVVSGTWCDARGPLWPVRIGLLCFGGGLLGCGLAGTFPVLLAGRAVAGAGGGLLIVAMYVVIADVYPSALQPRLFSLISAGWVLPGLIGPVLAGWLAENVSWRAVFLLVPPLALPAALALLPRLRPDQVTAVPGVRRRVTAGVGLAAGVLALQWGLAALGESSGVRLTVAAIAAGGGLLLAGLAFWHLVPTGTLTLRRGLPTVITLRGLYAGMFTGVEVFIPLMLVTERGMSAVEAGLVLTGATLGWTSGSMLQARSETPRIQIPRHRLMVAGAGLVAVGDVLLVLAVRPPVPAWAALGFWSLAAVGMGLAMSSTSVLVLRYSETGQEGRNSAALQLSDAFGSALGIGLAGAAFATWHRPEGSDATLFTVMWLAFAVVALGAAAIGFRVRRP